MSSIDPSKLHEVQTIFLAAAKLAPEERAAFLDKSCENNSELRQSVDLMLMSSDQAGSFMKDPAIGSFRDSVTESGDSIYPGMVLSFYRILNILGKGGMGNVYLAEDTRLERKVALKILPAALASDADTMRRFLREAKAASALNHTNILTIYENGEADGLNFIATEYVEGDTLTDLLGRGPLSLAVEIGRAHV